MGDLFKATFSKESSRSDSFSGIKKPLTRNNIPAHNYQRLSSYGSLNVSGSRSRDLGNFRMRHLLSPTELHNKSIHDSVIPSVGTALSAGMREKMENAFQRDFSSVRIRTNPGLVRQGFSAITRGELIESSVPLHNSGPSEALLGHELTHVLQQREGCAIDTMKQRSGYGGQLEQQAARSGRLAAKGFPVCYMSARKNAPVSVAQASGPLTDAVEAVRAHGPGIGSSMITEQLVQGVLEAEGEFLRMSPGNRLAESLGFSGTVGPGQLGEPAVASVDSNFSVASTQFASLNSPAPSSWSAKATHPQWSFFYIAAYLAFSINEAERVFHASPPVMTAQQLGVLGLGIAMYHGAYSTIRDMRRRIANEQNGSPSDVSWQMVQDELRSGTATFNELQLERYTMLAQGAWDFGFEINSAILSRLFDVSGGKVRVSILANYTNPTLGIRANEFTVQLRKREVACSMGGCAEGYNVIGNLYRFTVGTRGTASWTDLAPGTYQLYIRKSESPYSPDFLSGRGRVETIY